MTAKRENDDDLEEADLLVEHLPRGDLTGPEFTHHRTEPLNTSSRRSATSRFMRHKTTATRVEHRAAPRLVANHRIDYLKHPVPQFVACCRP